MRKYGPLSKHHKEKLRIALTGNKNAVGFVVTKVIRRNMSKAKIGNKNAYVGYFVSYQGEHKWIRENWGQPQFCEFCGAHGLKGKIDRFNWAKKHSGASRENRNEWLRLCNSCHQKYDRQSLTKRKDKK